MAESHPLADLPPMAADLPLRKASLHIEGGDAFWTSSMPAVLAAYPQITPDGYWNLTVAEFAELWDRAAR